MATVTQMVLKARQHADMENSGFIGAAEAIAFVSDAYKELYDLLGASFEDYFLSTTTLSLTSGNSVALPTDFYKLRGVDLYEGGRYHPLKPFNFNERLYMEDDDVTGSYRLWYVPTATTLTAGSDTVTLGNGWESYIELDAAIRMLNKEESDISALMALKEGVKARITTVAKNRDVSMPQVITDIHAQGYLDCRDLRYRVMGSSLYVSLYKGL